MGLGGVGWGKGLPGRRKLWCLQLSLSLKADDSPGRNGMETLGWDLRATKLGLRRRAAIWPFGNGCGGNVVGVAKAES